MLAAKNARAVARARDTAILEALEHCRYLSRDQVQALVFGHTYRQKCCQRLMTLHKARKLSRRRVDVTGSYVYFLPGERWNQKSEHALQVNWVYIALVKQLKSWFKLQAFIREFVAGWRDERLAADALAVLANKATKELKPVFIELDRGTSNNRFDKVQRYGNYYTSKAWVGEWWARPDGEGRYRFPRVLVVTDRPGKVQEIIARDNAAGIRFAVATLADVQKDVYSWL